MIKRECHVWCKINHQRTVINNFEKQPGFYKPGCFTLKHYCLLRFKNNLFVFCVRDVKYKDTKRADRNKHWAKISHRLRLFIGCLRDIGATTFSRASDRLTSGRRTQTTNPMHVWRLRCAFTAREACIDSLRHLLLILGWSRFASFHRAALSAASQDWPLPTHRC